MGTYSDVDDVLSKETALNYALAGMRFETARFLIEKGADLSKPADYRMPLNWAVQAGNLDIARLMLDKGADMQAMPETALGKK